MKTIIYLIIIIVCIALILFGLKCVFTTEAVEEAVIEEVIEESFETISNNEPITDWRKAVYDMNDEIKNRRGLKVENFEGKLDVVANELLK